MPHSPGMFTIAHLSDIHLGGHPQAAERTERVLRQIVAMSPTPDLVLLTGDVADHGLVEEYTEAHDLLSVWPGPRLVCPGNHDVREPFAEVLLDRPAGSSPVEPLDQAYAVGGFRFLLLDSLIPARDGVRVDPGRLAPATLTWLDQQLSADDSPTFVAFHHPPVNIGVLEADRVQLENGDELAEVLGRHPQVLATLVGHHHTACATTFAGRPLLIGGGVVSTVTLNAEDRPLIDYDAPPTMAFHLVEESRRITTFWRAY